MAASQTGTFTLTFVTAAGVSRQLNLPATSFTLAGKDYLQYIQTIPTTAGGTALNVAGLTAPRWLAVINRDATNYVDIMTATSGTAFARLLPGEGLMLPLNSGITAPAALAHTAAVDVEVLLIEN